MNDATHRWFNLGVTVALVVSFSIAIIGWEAFESLISDAGPFAGDVPDALRLPYGDTVGDLVISSTGGPVGSSSSRSWIGRAVLPATDCRVV